MNNKENRVRYVINPRYNPMNNKENRVRYAIINNMPSKNHVIVLLSSASAEEIGISLMSSVNILFSLMADGFCFKSNSSGFCNRILRMVE
jgi:hypothetical protein